MNLEENQYLNLLIDVINNGNKKNIYGIENKYLYSVFGRLLKFDLSNNKIPIYTTKKVFYEQAFKEMLWFLKGNNNVAELAQQKVNIWNEFAFKYFKQNNKNININLEEFVQKYLLNKKEFNIPLHYSNSTKWKYKENYYLDQTKYIIDSIKNNPDRKSYVVSYWNPTQVYSMADECENESVVLPACHFSYTVNISNNKLNLCVKIRSNDLFIGNPFNTAQYGLLTYMYAFCCGYKPGELIVMIDDAHIYSDHLEAVTEQYKRIPVDFPTLNILDRGQKYLTDFIFEDFIVNNYNPEKYIKAPLTVVGGYDKK